MYLDGLRDLAPHSGFPITVTEVQSLRDLANSFVAVVEFGEKVRAKAVTAGGESGSPASKHFNDQAQRYSIGSLRDVYFYPADVKTHKEREYHP